ncbi:TRAP transporter large permease [Marinobacterium aestuariivivens]|uniref:TRAP transporter large permease protein n=1 Tax=Marinobacterium aestuariivivens TaxID=1698799 RepID=A0ABW2AA34_9GAMM
MSTAMIGALGFVSMFLMMFMGLPVALAMLLVGVLGMGLILTGDAAMHLLSSAVWEQLSAYSLTVIPLFVLMGQVAYRSGVTERIYQSAYTWFGRTPGGIASTTVLASMGFSCISGSNSATAATMGAMAIPEMRKYKYNDTLSTGSVAIGGTLGAIIPPSVVLIVIAVQTEQSIIKLFLGSLIPGLMLTALLVATIFFICFRNRDLGPAGPAFTLKEKLVGLKGIVEPIAIFTVVMSGLFLGIFTPTEAGAAGAFCMVLVAVVRKQIAINGLIQCIAETLRISSMVLLLLAAAVIFGKFLAVTRIPFELAEWVADLPVSSVLILLVILAVYTLGGMLMDSLGFLVATLPIFFPLASSLGFDPIWFTVMLTLVTSLGAVTPPVGVNVFIVSSFVPEVPVQRIFKGVGVFILAYIVCLGLIAAFPSTVLMLPGIM